jgi:hypothetical protein
MVLFALVSPFTGHVMPAPVPLTLQLGVPVRVRAKSVFPPVQMVVAPERATVGKGFTVTVMALL